MTALAEFREWIARAKRDQGRYGSPLGDTPARPADLALFEQVAEEYAILQRRDDEREDQG